MIRRVPDISRSLRIPTDLHVKTTRLPDTPPWRPPAIQLNPDLIRNIGQEDSNEMKRDLAYETIYSRYPDHLHIYTDGSKVEESTTAGIWIPHFIHSENWKLDYGQVRSTMCAELYAINKGFTWLLLHKEILLTNQVVFLTDSRSSIEAMKNYMPKHQSHLINIIKNKGYDLTESNIKITIQWIPSHVGVDGNEMADEIARAGHTNDHLIPAALDISDVKILVKRAQHTRWQRIYDVGKQNIHIGPIKPTIEKWPWSNTKRRLTETAMVRLRIGHVGLNKHLHRFNMADSPLCEVCREQETVQHYLLTCRRYERQRIKLKTRLNKMNINDINHITLLGGSQHSPKVKIQITKVVEDYLQDTGRLGSL